jgi:hypothetical protein
VLQVTLAAVYIALGTFDQILGYFVPAAVFFLGLSAAAVLRLPRPHDEAVFGRRCTPCRFCCSWRSS